MKRSTITIVCVILLVIVLSVGFKFLIKVSNQSIELNNSNSLIGPKKFVGPVSPSIEIPGAKIKRPDNYQLNVPKENTTPFAIPPGSRESFIKAEQVIKFINDDRNSQHLSSLALNSKLVAAAQAKADDMAKLNYFSHFSPIGKTFIDFANDAGYNWAYLAENIAADYSDALQEEIGWMNSQTHRENILGNYKDIGVGIHGTIVVVFFGIEQN